VDGTGKQTRAAWPAIPDFTSLAWQMSQTELEITHRIQDGNEPSMPAYRDKLSQQEILALTVYVRAFAVEPTEFVPKPPQPSRLPEAAHMPPVQVYRAYCLACHDADGRGRTIRKAMPNIPDLTDPKWQAAHSDAELSKSILGGKGPFMLPMKDKLSPADADRIVAYLRGFRSGKQVVQVEPQPPVVPPAPDRPTVVPGPKEVRPAVKPRPTPAPKETAVRTRVATGLYRQYCLSCHGTDGRGRELKASMPTIPDFTNRVWQEEVNNPQLLVGILDGKGTLMPAFRGRVNEAQARDLAAYIRAFGPVRVALPTAPADDLEKRIRELKEQWEELDRQMRELSGPPRKPGK
jgi:mono/diheme cytochrome c family protein